MVQSFHRDFWEPSSLSRSTFILDFFLIQDYLGGDMRSFKPSISHSLCSQVLTSPIHWTKATNFPKMATHALDFSPGGISGIGPLTTRNFDGKGV